MNDESRSNSNAAIENAQKAEQATFEAVRILESHDILAGRQEVIIRHQGELYRLRLTRNDKLILNK